MSGQFKTLLIPVDLSFNTEVAVKKALEFAEPNSTVHLLHVQNYSAVKTGTGHPMTKKEFRLLMLPERKLNEWKETIEKHRNTLNVCTWTAMGDSVQYIIEKKARQLAADLIILGKHAHHSWFPFLNTVVPSEIAQETGIAVLTVKPGSIYNRTKTIVVPISNETALSKLNLIESVCEKFKVKIHLLTFTNGKTPSEYDTAALVQIYEWIRSCIKLPVEHKTLTGTNKAKLILNYANEIDADMLIVDPVAETKIGWPNKHISDVVPLMSKLQVLAIRNTN